MSERPLLTVNKCPLLVVHALFGEEVSAAQVAHVYRSFEATVRAVGGFHAQVGLLDEKSSPDAIWTDEEVVEAIARSKAGTGA